MNATPLVVYLAGVAWDGVEGTDHRLVESLSRRLPVLWVDPPMPVSTRIRRRWHGTPVGSPGLTALHPGLWRLHVVTLPGVTRPVIRTIAGIQSRWMVRRYLRRSGARRVAVVLAQPEGRFVGFAAEKRIYHITDDFVRGAELLGIDARRAERKMRENVGAADTVLTVSSVLAERVRVENPGCRDVRVLQNGCDTAVFDRIKDMSPPPELRLTPPIAGLVGQLNERIDMALLRVVAESVHSLLLVGPRCEQSQSAKEALDEILALPNVQWAGRQPFSSIPRWMSVIDVGLTPYAKSDFNDASFPLKTLEYLAAGRRVISTKLPSATTLATDMVDICTSPEEFVRQMQVRLAEGVTEESSQACRAVARRHSWDARGEQLAGLLGWRSAVRKGAHGGEAIPTGRSNNRWEVT